jgi:hypothetical protein
LAVAVQSLLAQAKSGDLAAIQLLLEYTVGKPIATAALDSFDLPDAQLQPQGCVPREPENQPAPTGSPGVANDMAGNAAPGAAADVPPHRQHERSSTATATSPAPPAPAPASDAPVAVPRAAARLPGFPAEPRDIRVSNPPSALPASLHWSPSPIGINGNAGCRSFSPAPAAEKTLRHSPAPRGPTNWDADAGGERRWQSVLTVRATGPPDDQGVKCAFPFLNER